MQRFLAAAACAAAILFTTPAYCADREIWAQSRISGSAAGYYHESSSVQPDGSILTLVDNDIVLNRMGSKVEIKSSTQYHETADGRLLSIDNTSSSSAQSTTMHVDDLGTSLAIRTTTGGKSYNRSTPLTSPVLGPEAARRLTVTRLKAPGDTLSYPTFSPDLGSLTTITEKCIAVRPLAIEQSMSAMPTTVTEWLDDDGWLMRQTMPSPFGNIETVRASAESVKAQSGAGATLPKEAFRSTLVDSNIRLPEERLIEELKIRITQKNPELGWPELKADNQTVLASSPDHAVLEIRRVAPDESAPRVMTPLRAELRPYLDPNALVQSDDPEVRKIAASVAGDETSAYRAARKLQQWTNEHMSFDLGIAVAPASEVVRNRRGTCMGYAILLASLLRADDIPSRIRMGFVYAGGIWGGHAWVEALTGDRWVPLDGALYSPGSADAARVSFFTSALEEGTIAGMGALAKMYGNVDIEILEYTIHGKRVVLPPGAKAYTIAGDTYSNPWIGLSVKKPAAFRFTSLDSVWPSSTLLAMKGPNGEALEIQSHSSSLPVSLEAAEERIWRAANLKGKRARVEIGGTLREVVSSESEAGLLILHGGDVLLVTATGSKPINLLTQVVSTLKFAAGN